MNYNLEENLRKAIEQGKADPGKGVFAKDRNGIWRIKDALGEYIKISDVIAKAPSFDHDALLTFETGGIRPSLFESISIRPTQEDAYSINTTATRHDTGGMVPDFLWSAFDAIAATFPPKIKVGGTVANVCYLSSDKDCTITIANAGDARTVLFVRDIESGKVECHRLSYDHKTNDPEEIKRIEAAGGKVIDLGVGGYRIGGQLAVARAFGNKDIKGVDYKPDISQCKTGQWVNDPKKEVYLCNACDGLYHLLSEKDYARALEKYLPAGSQITSEQLKTLPQFLSGVSFTQGGTDNVTAICTKLEPKRTNDLVFGIFDGHGGKASAKYAAWKMGKLACGLSEHPPHPVEKQITPPYTSPYRMGR